MTDCVQYEVEMVPSSTDDTSPHGEFHTQGGVLTKQLSALEALLNASAHELKYFLLYSFQSWKHNG